MKQKNKTTSFAIRHTNINIAITREKIPLPIIMWFGQGGSLHYLKVILKHTRNIISAYA